MGLIPKRNEKRLNRWYFGGVASCAAVLFTHPLDLIKVLLQTQTQNASIAQNVKLVYKNRGIGGFYNGLSASLMRQATYTNSRFAIYEVGKGILNADTVGQRTVLAIFAGVISSVVGVPMDMVNVRMQNDMKLPENQRRNYKHVGDGLMTTYREGGIKTLFSGCTFATCRGVLMTLGQNVVYDEAKVLLKRSLKYDDGIPLHISSSLIAAIISTVLTQPMDVLKTRRMNAKPGEYSGNLDVFLKTAQEGPRAFFKGIVPAFLRLGPQTILLFMFMEQLRLYFGYLRKQDQDSN